MSIAMNEYIIVNKSSRRQNEEKNQKANSRNSCELLSKYLGTDCEMMKEW